ncbi:MAG: hypothetical protein DME17_10335 [Candidatus Rokuibacteriota bacterium]|nr:MAG: hypothetical protein DME17_10335 [Candidatus Rokubacteria bacterium]
MIALAFASGCGRLPEYQKARHLERGNKYFERQQYQEAILEYRNVLRIDPTNPVAVRRAGASYYQLGQLGLALGYLQKSKQLDPHDFDVRVELATIDWLEGRRDQARAEAVVVLQNAPTNLNALLLFAGTARSPDEADEAIQRLQGARVHFDDRAKLHLALATLYEKQQDLIRAEREFEEAVAKEPNSVEAHLALGNFYLTKRDAARAEQQYKTAADRAPVGSLPQIHLADFYLLSQQPERAKRVLRQLTQKAPEYLLAWRRLAQIALAERRYDEAIKILDAVFKRSPSDFDAHLLRGQVYRAQGETPQATEEFQQILKVEPRRAEAHVQLALAHLQAGNARQAKAELSQAVTLDPNLTDAVLLLAQLDSQTGAVQPAIDALETLSARHPNEARAHVLLGSLYLTTQHPIRATEVYRKLLALAPKDPRGFYLLGVSFRAQRQNAEAGKAFETALAIAPDFVEPLAELVALDFAEKGPARTLLRVRNQIVLEPKSAGLQELLGRVHLARHEEALAEGAFLKALVLDPRRTSPYLELGRLYTASGKYDQALAKLSEAVKVDPKNLAALMLSGAVYAGNGNVARAEETYQQVLALAPRFAPAANNLAYLYSEHGGDPERALQLAQTAKQLAPDDPHISDTLGWIFYKRGLYHRAVGLLRESAARLDDRPEVQYHLGLASLKVGDRVTATKALTLAVTSTANFNGKSEAKRVLTGLQ